MLSPRGYEVVTAADGLDALEVIRREHVDICLLDVMMPGMNGFEVCRRIKSDYHHLNIPVVMITSLMDKKNRILAIEAGSEDYISKPFYISEVLARIKMLLQVKSQNERICQENLESAKEQAESGTRAKRQFLNNMSHELRTPINDVLGLAQLLEMTDLDQKQRDYMEDLRQSGSNLLTLVNDILDLSRIESGKLELERTEFDLRSETTSSVNQLSVSAHEKGLEVESLIDSDVPLLFNGDAGRLRHIFTNLIGNAIKFTTKGSVALHIRMECENDSHATLRFIIRDTGIGIASDKLEMIFDLFTQVNGASNRSYEGTGLGLTLSRQLVELMGGRIGVESIEGEGSIFWFTSVLEKAGRCGADA